jgi:cellulose synthase/poly-beta-1,6-N-acetylglucosamine synthase-like glycosyltransferase
MHTIFASLRPAHARTGTPARRTFLVRTVALVMLSINLVYLIWRALFTLDPGSWWIGGPFLLMEIHLFISLALLTFSLWDTTPMPAAQPVETTTERVAVLIPTYNEGREILLPVIAAAVALVPQHETWVLDDGNRPWLRQLADELGAHYLARTDRSHAKAGNINHALGVIQADLVAFLDADHIPTANFLTHTLGYFGDPTVALVQTPQAYYNIDSFEHAQVAVGDGAPERQDRWYEQAMFFRAVQAGKNHWGAAFWCGTGAVMRLAALRDIGGIPTTTITEDMHTTIKLHQRGWRSIYHNAPLARGLAARTAGEYQAQRFRWGAGAMQILRADNPLATHGLSLPQRIEYTSSMLFWFESWRTLGLLVVPIVVLLTGTFPLRAHLLLFLLAWGGVSLLQELVSALLTRGYRRPLLWVMFRLIDMTPNLLATLTLFRRRPLPFRVTEKGRLGEQRERAALPRPLLALALGSALSLIWFGLSAAGYTPLHYDNVGAATINAFWVAVNLGLILAAIVRVRSIQFGTERRSGFRFATNLSGMLASHPCRIQDVSMTGALLSITSDKFPDADAADGRVTVDIDVPHETVTLTAEVRSRRAVGPNRAIYGVQFCDGQTQEVGRLALALASTWVEEAHIASRAERPNALWEAGELAWRPEMPQQPQLVLAPVEVELAS